MALGQTNSGFYRFHPWIQQRQPTQSFVLRPPPSVLPPPSSVLRPPSFPMHIALFGTSADPPTLGHYQILVWLTKHYDWVATWASDNPFKQHRVSLDHRHAMLGRVVTMVQESHPNIGLAPDLSAPRTLHTLERAQQQWPQAQFTLVIGSDLLAQLPRWYQAQRLLQQVTLLVIPRPGSPLHEATLEELRQLGTQVAIAPLMGLAVSSSAYRDRGEVHALPATVQDYIHQQRLYPWPDAAPANPHPPTPSVPPQAPPAKPMPRP